jgi:hypothetical protein
MTSPIAAAHVRGVSNRSRPSEVIGERRLMINPQQYQVIEGQRTLVVERTPPLPSRLDALIASMFSLSVSIDIKPAGTSVACEQWRTHRFTTIRQGRALCRDRMLRDLRVDMCADCGAVCVRDISYDRLGGLPIGGRGPARRDLILGWYSGARRNSRLYT